MVVWFPTLARTGCAHVFDDPHIQRFTAGHRQKYETQRDEADRAVLTEEADRIDRVDCSKDTRQNHAARIGFRPKCPRSAAMKVWFDAEVTNTATGIMGS
jgi:hypothetical protein